MKKEEFAAQLNNREYLHEILPDEEKIAKENGLVIVFGASDDLCEIRGAVYDEVGCFSGGEIYFNKFGLVKNQCDDERCPYFKESKKTARKIDILWGMGGYSWIYKIDIPHSTFDILEDGPKEEKPEKIDDYEPPEYKTDDDIPW